MADRKSWTREEDAVTCALYAVTPYRKIHSQNAQIIEVAKKLNCTTSSLVKKLTMYASLDPVGRARGHKGFDSASIQMRNVFAEFQKDWKSIMEQAEAIVGPLQAED